MSTLEKVLDGKALPLPSPRSPAQLDERILAEARAAVPRERSYRQPWWLAGATATAVIVVTVSLSATNWSGYQATPYQEIRSESDNMMNAPEIRVENAPMNVASDAAIPTTQSAPKREQKSLAKARVSPAKPTTMAMPSSERVDSYAASAALAEPAITATFSEGERVVKKLPEVIMASLRQLAEMDTSSGSQNASDQYENLKRSCSQCNLPKTLDEAIAKHLPQQH